MYSGVKNLFSDSLIVSTVPLSDKFRFLSFDSLFLEFDGADCFESAFLVVDGAD